MTNAKEKLVARLLDGSHDIFTEFVIVGLEDGLETICKEIERLLNIKNLTDAQHTDLNELYLDGKATIRVLYYYTGHRYESETQIMNKSFNKMLGEVF